jgi:hypothetical protein
MRKDLYKDPYKDPYKHPHKNPSKDLKQRFLEGSLSGFSQGSPLYVTKFYIVLQNDIIAVRGKILKLLLTKFI